MSKLRIVGGKPLKGEIRVAGHKNSALKLMPAALLSTETTTLSNVPAIRDVEVLADVMRELGVEVLDNGEGSLTINPSGLNSWEPNPELMGRIRAGIVIAAPLLIKFGKVNLPRPGGDSIGDRLIDTHASMMQAFGATVENEHRMLKVDGSNLKPGNIFLEEASPTATEMALMIAAALPGESIIEGAACEPHVVDLEEMLVEMGAKIEGVGTHILKVTGSENLKGVEHRVRPDYLEVGTFAIASAITGGEITIHDAWEEDLKIILIYLEKMGVRYEFVDKKTLKVLPSELKAKQTNFKTRPWPGFPSDLMSPFIVLATQTEGTVLCHDWMYESRMFFVDMLRGMGATIVLADPHRAIVSGPTKLRGDVVQSPDIRAGGAAVLAALAASGESIVEHAEIIDRGYESFEKKLAALGADIERLED